MRRFVLLAVLLGLIGLAQSASVSAYPGHWHPDIRFVNGSVGWASGREGIMATPRRRAILAAPGRRPVREGSGGGRRPTRLGAHGRLGSRDERRGPYLGLAPPAAASRGARLRRFPRRLGSYAGRRAPRNRRRRRDLAIAPRACAPGLGVSVQPDPGARRAWPHRLRDPERRTDLESGSPNAPLDFANRAAPSLRCSGAGAWLMIAGGFAAGSQGYAVYSTPDGIHWRLVLGQFLNGACRG